MNEKDGWGRNEKDGQGSDKDPVLMEEREKLRQVESTLDKAIRERRAREAALEKEILDFHPFDYEDIRRKKEIIDLSKKVSAELEYYGELKPSPYFGRSDLDREIGDDYEINTHYIGKKGLAFGENVLIVDWRTPVGECFYAQNQTEFNIEGDVYSLALRRALTIRNGTLTEYRTEYDGNDVSLEGEVIDPFLLTVLRDKRRQNRLTDIIRSIQANQNEIIRRPIKESFIVQGCAGSGKTMILLHRLSYLKYNNRGMPLAAVKIITPNPDFNAHIDELSRELEIDSIRKFTVEEYYVDLINRYHAKSGASAAVSSESALKPGLLGEIYSGGFMDRLLGKYHSHWTAVLEAIDEPRLRASFQLHKTTYPATNAHNAQTAIELATGVARMIEENKERAKRFDGDQEQLAAFEEEYKNKEGLCTLAAAAVEESRAKIVESARSELAAVTGEIARIGEDSRAARGRLQELTGLDGGAAEELRRAEKELETIRGNYRTYTEYERFTGIKDAISESVAAACSDRINRIRAIEDDIHRTPAYNFVRRNSLRRQLQDAAAAFSEDAKAYVDSVIAGKESELSASDQAAEAHRKEIAELSDTVAAADREMERLQRRQAALNAFIKDADSSSGLDPAPVFAAGALKGLEAWLADHEKITRNLKKQKAEAATILKRIESLKAHIQPPYDEDIAYLEACEKEIVKLSANEMYRQVVRKALHKAYSDHGEEYTRTNYRHKLFLMLLFSSWYYKRPVNMDTYLNIDEAQDISIAEYTLLREILGKNCVFNLYGDINQSLFPEKSVMAWEDLSGIAGENVFVLNEDYRNTLQITEYCNREFSAEIYPIGIRGGPVSEMKTDEAVRWLAGIKNAEPQYRAAIIVHKDSATVRERISAILSGEKVSWYAVNDEAISILTVENAKGMEFEAVAVLCDGMEINERYIAYTRALDHLCVAGD